MGCHNSSLYHTPRSGGVGSTGGFDGQGYPVSPRRVWVAAKGSLGWVECNRNGVLEFREQVIAFRFKGVVWTKDHRVWLRFRVTKVGLQKNLRSTL